MTCPAWCETHDGLNGPDWHYSIEVILSTATLNATAWLEAPADAPDAPKLRLESDGVSSDDAGIGVGNAEEFVTSVEEYGWALGQLVALGRDPETAVASLIPALLRSRNDAFWVEWEAQQAERAEVLRQYRVVEKCASDPPPAQRLTALPTQAAVAVTAPRGRLRVVSDSETTAATPQPAHVELTGEVSHMARILGPRYAGLLAEFFDAAWEQAPAGLVDRREPVVLTLPPGLLARLLEAGADVSEALDG